MAIRPDWLPPVPQDPTRPSWGKEWMGLQLIQQGINGAGGVTLLDTMRDLESVYGKRESLWVLEYQVPTMGVAGVAIPPIFLVTQEYVAETMISRGSSQPPGNFGGPTVLFSRVRATARRVPLFGRRVKVVASRIPNPPIQNDLILRIGVSAVESFQELPTVNIGVFTAQAAPATPSQIAAGQGCVRRLYGGANVADATSTQHPSWFQLFDSAGQPAPGTAPILSVGVNALEGLDCDTDYWTGLWGALSIDPQTFVPVPGGYTGTACVNVDGWGGP